MDDAAVKERWGPESEGLIFHGRGVTIGCVNHPFDRPVLLFDGDCEFCRLWVARWADRAGEGVRFVPFQEAEVRFVPFQEAEELAEAIPAEKLPRAVHLIRPGLPALVGAAAVFALPGMDRSVWGWLYRRSAAVRCVADAGCGWIAKHRTAASRVTRWLWGREVRRPTWVIGSDAFVRLLGLVYAIAFASLAVQVAGLMGSRGLAPAVEFLRAISDRLGPERFLRVPGLFWWGASDFALESAAWLGCAAGGMVAAGICQGPLLFVAWALYLSFCSVGSPFLDFQWDSLLLECTLLAAFLAPWRGWTAWRRPVAPSRVAHLGLRLLLFRLMFLSGLVKLTSGDPAWRDLTALSFHFETQPLPTVIGWVAHRLPAWFHALGVLATYAIELVLPWFVLGPRRLRQWAFLGFVGLMAAIALSGNYTFFNLLTAGLAVLLLDDSQWPRFLRHGRVAVAGPSRLRRRLAVPLVGVLAGLALIPFAAECLPGRRLPHWAASIYGWAAPFRSANGYGLFRVMTRPRREVELEGSMDGIHWEPYRFRWKPGPLDRMPGFVAPHQPRLDWQMWFAALGRAEQNPWFWRLCQRLLEAEPAVLGLLDRDPFGGRRPASVRATLYEYRFARAGKPGWWVRERVRAYTPELALHRSGK